MSRGIFSAVDYMSSADFPGFISTVFFVSGCPWDCCYCVNKKFLLDVCPKFSLVRAEEIVRERKDFIDAVVVSGGEPSLYPEEVESFFRWVKLRGLKVGLHSNGLDVEWLKSLLEGGLLDYLGVDIKTAPSKYEELIGQKLDPFFWDDLMSLSEFSQVEWRTTISPDFVSLSDLCEIGKLLNHEGVSQWWLQQARGHTTFSVAEIREALSTTVSTIGLRGFGGSYEKLL